MTRRLESRRATETGGRHAAVVRPSGEREVIEQQLVEPEVAAGGILQQRNRADCRRENGQERKSPEP